jgi:hypothetical protein
MAILVGMPTTDDKTALLLRSMPFAGVLGIEAVTAEPDRVTQTQAVLTRPSSP